MLTNGKIIDNDGVNRVERAFLSYSLPHVKEDKIYDQTHKLYLGHPQFKKSVVYVFA